MTPPRSAALVPSSRLDRLGELLLELLFGPVEIRSARGGRRL